MLLRRSIVTAATSSFVPITYHSDFRINPIPQEHRYPLVQNLQTDLQATKLHTTEVQPTSNTLTRLYTASYYRFPMPKDALLYERIHQLQQQPVNLAARIFTPTYPSPEDLHLAHDPTYVSSFIDGSIDAKAMRRIGLPWSPELVQRTLIGVGSAILAGRLALQYGVAMMCNGGTHHAHYAHGSGWCIFNDQAVAARAAQRDGGVERICFIDLDVHQGDGTAAIFSQDPSVYCFSMHCGDQPFPHTLQPSTLDIALPAGTTDTEYLHILRTTLPKVLQEAQPQLVFYNAGVDVSADDSLGKFSLTDGGILERDRAVMAACVEYGVSVAIAIGGGYCPEHERIVDRHMCTFKAAVEYSDGLRQVIVDRMMKKQKKNRTRTNERSLIV